jgi:hypothetical protein
MSIWDVDGQGEEIEEHWKGEDNNKPDNMTSIAVMKF